ncbi:hypothetical protein SDJN02_21665, partial [Cucurbita argyrosperma subsp. argyrosperma]
MEARLLCPGVSVFFALIGSLCQSGKLEEAEKYLKIMKDSSTNISNINLVQLEEGSILVQWQD